MGNPVVETQTCLFPAVYLLVCGPTEEVGGRQKHVEA